MASVEDCERALHGLAAKLARVDDDVRRRHTVDRSISCRVEDLDLTFRGVLRDGSLQDITRDGQGRAQIRLTVDSDDLIAITEGELNFAAAWATGRLRIDANPLDLIRLRSLL